MFWINRPFGLISTFFPNSIIHSQIILNFLNLTTVVTKVKRIQKLCILVKATGVHVVYYIGYMYFFPPKINFETKSYKCILFCESTRLFLAINRPAISLKKICLWRLQSILYLIYVVGGNYWHFHGQVS